MTPEAGEAPLTFGQLSVWRVMADWPPERWPETYLSTAVPAPPGCSVETVAAACRRLCERHESLRTHFAATPTGPVQIVRPGPGRVEIQAVEKPGATAAEAEAAARVPAAECFSRATEFARRFTVVTSEGQPVYVVVVVDHIVADGYGLRRLHRELAALLGDADAEGRRLLDEDPPQPRDLALTQRSPAGRVRHEAALARWHRLLDTLPPHLFPVPDQAGQTPGRIEAVLHSPGARRALGTAYRRLGVPPHGILLALTALATAAVTHSPQVVLTLQSSNRFTAPWNGVVSSMNQYVPLPLTIGGSGAFATFAKDVQAAALTAYRFGSYDLDTVADLVRTERGITLGFDHFFNFMAHDVAQDSPADSGPRPGPGHIEATYPNRHIGPRLDVKIRGGPDMPVVVRADPRLIPQPRLHALLGWYDEELRRLADAADADLDAVLSRCAAAADGSLTR
ncbi:condensation domain-containing protein [Streptomyces sp. NPDC048254]|uniref:condensation domain-containing protein n=1 Tax=Streptomyces sp. NPDC048254 TaxID=3365525 RepID=UPI00370FF6FF